MEEWIQLIAAGHRQPKEQSTKSASQIADQQSVGVIQKEFETVLEDTEREIVRSNDGKTIERLLKARAAQI